MPVTALSKSVPGACAAILASPRGPMLREEAAPQKGHDEDESELPAAVSLAEESLCVFFLPFFFVFSLDSFFFFLRSFFHFLIFFLNSSAATPKLALSAGLFAFWIFVVQQARLEFERRLFDTLARAHVVVRLPPPPRPPRPCTRCHPLCRRGSL